MLDLLRGVVVNVSPQRIVLMVNGVGYGVQVARELSFNEGQEVTLYTVMHWNQEQGPSLFGFNTEVDKQIFALIVSCSGIGPKLGLAALATLSAHNIITIIAAGDAKALSSVPGIGLKKAESVILQLRDKVAKLVTLGMVKDDTPTTQTVRYLHEVNEVLISLNYSRVEATSALEYVKKNNDLTQQTFDSLLRKALSFLSKATL